MSDQEEDLAQQSEDGERDDGERDDGEEAADPEEENEGDDEADEADEDERPKSGASQRPETAKSVQVFMRITDGHFGQIQLGRLVH